MNIDRVFETFKKVIPHLRGALWWGRNDLIKSRQAEFNPDDEHIGHPLLSVRKTPVESRFDMLPMLVGTTGVRMDDDEKGRCVIVTGMTKADPTHKTYFGAIVMPGNYSLEELIKNISRTKGEYFVKKYDRHTVHGKAERGNVLRRHWYENRTMYPNDDKRVVTEEEMKVLNNWCDRHHL